MIAMGTAISCKFVLEYIAMLADGQANKIVLSDGFPKFKDMPKKFGGSGEILEE